ncbi:hypothetical protein SAMN06265171_107171 [Chryseobacterium rhizoplanae]|uniref:Uncharacterized protein n=1 Tax=Chryseobacterium rhizoplanae TaxID=1609531 RepID=A0A521EB77_9FLAO|nr:hypothetical protein SAMN06265171_107171 [Chryseobacterium rhizoplanae]
MIFFRFFSIKFNNRLTVIKKLLYLHHNNCTTAYRRDSTLELFCLCSKGQKKYLVEWLSANIYIEKSYEIKIG